MRGVTWTRRCQTRRIDAEGHVCLRWWHAPVTLRTPLSVKETYACKRNVSKERWVFQRYSPLFWHARQRDVGKHICRARQHPECTLMVHVSYDTSLLRVHVSFDTSLLRVYVSFKYECLLHSKIYTLMVHILKCKRHAYLKETYTRKRDVSKETCTRKRDVS